MARIYFWPLIFATHLLPESHQIPLPDPNPLPGHMAIPYYIRQKEDQVDF